MMKKILVIAMCFFNLAGFACSNALPTDNPGFCASFKSAATCYCTSSGIPAGMCQDMNTLYRRMVGTFGSLQKACEFQRYTTTQDCMDNWNCYLFGGTDSRGRLCSATRKPCQ